VGRKPLQHGDLPALALRRLASPDMHDTLYNTDRLLAYFLMCVSLANNTLRATGVVAQDELDAHGALRTLYISPACVASTTRIAEHEQLYNMSDELAGCTGEILREGHFCAWQFAHLRARARHAAASRNWGHGADISEYNGARRARGRYGGYVGDGGGGGRNVASEIVEALCTILQVAILKR